jgi:hypothetical protein
MPTNRRVRTRKRVPKVTISPWIWAFLNDQPIPEDANPFDLLFRDDYKAMLLPWEEHRKVIIADWIKSKPGTRPCLWWRYSAPRLAPEALGRWSRTVLAPQLIELRRKLRGGGNPLHEVLAYSPAQHYGIPDWCGNPDDPPVFESQHTYLKRHGLLLPAERGKIEEPFPNPLRIVPSNEWNWPKDSRSVK